MDCVVVIDCGDIHRVPFKEERLDLLWRHFDQVTLLYPFTKRSWVIGRIEIFLSHIYSPVR